MTAPAVAAAAADQVVAMAVVVEGGGEEPHLAVLRRGDAGWSGDLRDAVPAVLVVAVPDDPALAASAAQTAGTGAAHLVEGVVSAQADAAVWLADRLAAAGAVVHRPLGAGTGRSGLHPSGRDAATCACCAPAAAAAPAVVAALGPRPTLVLAVPVDRRLSADTAAEAAWAGLAAPVRRAVADWWAAHRARRVLLAAPRSFCAGVERAVEIVERSLERFGTPVYVRRQIVHNQYVVSDLERRGAVFVQELDEVPDGATVVLAAHGVAPSVRQAAERRALTVVDATCPLVAKVHREARRFVAEGRRIVLIGHADHEEVEGTVGEAPEHIAVVADADDVARLDLAENAPVAYLTQTTLAVDETRDVVERLQARFANLVGPAADDICYATQNRQDAVRALAPECDVVLVVGSANSSNTMRLVEVARRHGARAELVEDATALRLEWLAGATTVGVTAGASAPETLVQGVVDAVGALGPISVSEHRTTEEHVRFTLPQQVR